MYPYFFCFGTTENLTSRKKFGLDAVLLLKTLKTTISSLCWNRALEKFLLSSPCSSQLKVVNTKFYQCSYDQNDWQWYSVPIETLKCLLIIMLFSEQFAERNRFVGLFSLVLYHLYCINVRHYVQNIPLLDPVDK